METSAQAFSLQAKVFDDYNESNCITRYCRDEIYKIALKYLPGNSDILELNCGTGIDAIYFSKNHKVLATDGAEGMINVLNHKINKQNIPQIETKCISFDQLDLIGNRKFDFIFSNFGGLNCTENLADVVNKLPLFLKDNGRIMLVMMPPICLWEHLHVFSFNFKLAFRRWKKSGANAKVEGVKFKTYYYHPGFVSKLLKEKFKIVYLQGLCNIMPPEYMHHYLKSSPMLFKMLSKADRFINRIFPFKQTGDYFVIVMEKKKICIV